MRLGRNEGVSSDRGKHEHRDTKDLLNTRGILSKFAIYLIYLFTDVVTFIGNKFSISSGFGLEIYLKLSQNLVRT